MSMATEQPENRNLGAFASPPSTAAMYHQQYVNSEAGRIDGANNPQPQVPTPSHFPSQEDMQITVPAARKTNYILPPQTPQTATANQPQTVAVPPTPAQGQSEAVSNPPVPASAAPLPQPDVAWQRQLELERQAWAQERAQWQAAVQQRDEGLSHAAALQQEYNQLKQQADLAQQLSGDDLFANLTTVDADDARHLVQLTAQTLQAPLDTMRQQLQQQQQQIAQQQQYINAQMGQLQRQRASESLQAAHPDFAQLVHDPRFLQFMQQRDGYSSRTREQAAWEEFNRGNAEYVINAVNDFKGIAPKVDTLQSAPPVQVASAEVAAAPVADPAPQYTLADLNNMMQMRQITPDQYRAMIAELRKSQATQPS